MTADTLTPLPASEPLGWSLYPDTATAARLLGAPVAHLPGHTPLTIAAPTGIPAGPVRQVWARYRDPRDGALFGAATYPWPTDVSSDGHPEAIAVLVGTVLQANYGISGPADLNEDISHAAGPLTIDGATVPAVLAEAARGVYVRAARLPGGTVIALWGPARILDLPLTTTG
jgi:hypothetical protein